MYREELEGFIQQLRPEGGTPFFSIQDGSDGAGYIRANREGLQAFARELLRASLSLDYSRDGAAVPLSRQVPAGIRLTHVEPFDGDVLVLPEPPAPPGWKARLTRAGVWLGALVAAASLIIGFYTLLRWFF
ncbi:MAG: hypothetical protein EOO16_05565 [Chitinophagaceae bacterium]|nr:MAG: hypothetical protein EOO16_05565 [Chitinophagaceae bacterium]